MSGQMLEVARIRGVALARVRGVIDDHFGPELRRLLSLDGSLIIDLDDVSRITSSGVRTWLNVLEALECEYYCFVRCRPAMVAQFNMIRNFARRGELVSLYAPYVCDACGSEFEVLVDLRKDRNIVDLVSAPTACPKCGETAEFDDVAENYLSYVLSVSPPKPPPAVDAVLAVPFRVVKEVTADLTVLWLTGTLDTAARLKRAVDGLEGRILLVMADVVSMSRDGAAAVSALCRLDGASVELARVPARALGPLLAAPGGLGAAKVLSVKVPVKCAACGYHGSVDLSADKVPSGGSLVLACDGCGNPIELSRDFDELRQLPWEAADEVVCDYLSSAGPTTDANESSPSLALAIPREFHGPSGNYQVLRVLGHGGMGTVYLAKAVRPGGFERLVAIKKMHPHLSDQPDCVAMFLDEARLAARIHHPNVVATLDVARSAEGVLLVMDFVDGAPLADLLESRERLPTNVALRILFDALTGLHAAHELSDHDGQPLNLVHRDIKTGNLIVGVDGTTRVADFGIAVALNRLAATTAPGQMKGTLGFIPPEQARGQRVDRRADIFSMGLIACEALYVREGTRSLLDAFHLREELAAKLDAHADELTETQRVLLRACLPAIHLDPDQRYPTALAFLEALERAAAALSIGPATVRAVGSIVEGVHQLPMAQSFPTNSSSLATLAGGDD